MRSHSLADLRQLPIMEKDPIRRTLAVCARGVSAQTALGGKDQRHYRHGIADVLAAEMLPLLVGAA